MNRRLALCVVVSLAICGFLASAEDEGKASASNPAKAQFEQLKKLVGDWAGKASHEGGEPFDATIELVGDDQIKSAWTMFNNGKAAEKATFDLKRKK